MAPGFFEELLPLITDEFMGDPDTRPLVPLFVEEACRRRKGFIPMCTAMIVELSKDDNPRCSRTQCELRLCLFAKAS